MLNFRPLPPLCTYSDVINIELPSVGREPERERLFVIIDYASNSNVSNPPLPSGSLPTGEGGGERPLFYFFLLALIAASSCSFGDNLRLPVVVTPVSVTCFPPALALFLFTKSFQLE